MADQTKRIIYTNTSGELCILMPGLKTKLTLEEIAAKDIYDMVGDYEIINADEVPYDLWDFRNAFKHNEGGKKVGVEVTKAKLIAHDKRREYRDKEMKPYDEIIMKQIPGQDSADAENVRKLIREKYAKVQDDIDSASTPEELKSILDNIIT